MSSSLEKYIDKETKSKHFVAFALSQYAIGISLSECQNITYIFNSFLIFLIFVSLWCLYGHICFFLHYIQRLHIITEGLCVLLQITLVIAKGLRLFILQQRVRIVINDIIFCKIVQDIKIFQQELPKIDDVKTDVIECLRSSMAKAKWQFYIFSFCSILIGGFYLTHPVITNIYNWKINTENYTKVFSFKTYYPKMEDLKQRTPYFQLFVFGDMAADYMIGIASITFIGLYVYAARYIIALVGILKKLLQFSSSSHLPKDVQVRVLIECVKLHKKILALSYEINFICSPINIIQLLTSLINICVVVFQLTAGYGTNFRVFLNFLLFSCASMSELFIYCWNGQELITASETLPIICYSTRWYDTSKQFKNIILLMIMRTNHPISLTSYNILSMSFTTFLSVLKTSASYFMILQKVTKI